MAALNVNGRLHLTGVHQKSPASFQIWSTFGKQSGSCYIGIRIRYYVIHIWYLAADLSLLYLRFERIQRQLFDTQM